MRTTSRYLDAWLADGSISAAQHAALAALASRRRLSLFVELNALLYLGVLAIAGGLAWTARDYSDRWGDLAILGPASALVVGCFAWVFAVAPRYSAGRVSATSLALDYVLYLGCLVLGVVLGYAQYRVPALQARWHDLLLVSAVIYFAAAYRFDNRFVLSLGLATLGGWFGVSFSRFHWLEGGTTPAMTLLYGALVAAASIASWRADVKRHFLEAYLQVAALVVLSTLTWRVLDSDGPSPWLLAAFIGAALSVAGGIRYRRFSFVVYGAFAGYISISRELLRDSPGLEASFLYLVVSAALMVVGLVLLSRRMGRRA